PPSSCMVVGRCGAGWRPHGAARGARRPWWWTCGPSAEPSRAFGGRSDTEAAGTRRRSSRSACGRRSPLVSGRCRVLDPDTFDFSLVATRWFADTVVWLAPDPDAPFRVLTQAV